MCLNHICVPAWENPSYYQIVRKAHFSSKACCIFGKLTAFTAVFLDWLHTQCDFCRQYLCFCF